MEHVSNEPQIYLWEEFSVMLSKSHFTSGIFRDISRDVEVCLLMTQELVVWFQKAASVW